MNLKYTFSFISIFFLWTHIFSQVDNIEQKRNRTDIGIGVQVYPAGLIGSINIEKFLSNKSSTLLRAGLNYTDRKDFSPYNDNEKGNGFGVSIGYRKHFELKHGKIIAGIHTDIWNMWINWKNDIGTKDQTQGQSYTTVLQPWLEAGYFINPKLKSIHLGLSGGFGREINVITNGKEVGQGWMLSALLHIQYSIANANKRVN